MTLNIYRIIFTTAHGVQGQGRGRPLVTDEVQLYKVQIVQRLWPFVEDMELFFPFVPAGSHEDEERSHTSSKWNKHTAVEKNLMWTCVSSVSSALTTLMDLWTRVFLQQPSHPQAPPPFTRRTWPFLSCSTKDRCCRRRSLESLTFIFKLFIFCTLSAPLQKSDQREENHI